MKRFIYAVLISGLALIALTVFAAATSPTLVTQTIGGGKGHYTATLALSAAANVSDGTTIKTSGVTEQDFIFWVDNGTVTLTPQAGYYIYSGGAVVATRWIDLGDITGANSTGVQVHYPLACDLVRIKAASCSSCVFTAAWIGVAK